MSTDCVFCTLPKNRVVQQSVHAIAIRDGFPVSAGHTLIIPKRCVASWTQLEAYELADLWTLAKDQQAQLQSELSCNGFNIGINDGAAAGQTVFHLHVHLIPRFSGDKDDPRGGVRWLFPDKAKYWA